MREFRLDHAACCALLLWLSACSSSAPRCSDEETKELVKQIVVEELQKGLPSDAVAKIEISVDAIRTTDTDEKTGAHSCAAQLNLKGPGGAQKHDITYTSEKTDDGDEFYVTVYGL